MDKNFDDFVDSLTAEKIEMIANKANDVVQKNREELSDNSKTFLGNQIGLLSFNIAIGLIREYHEWMNI